MSGMSELRMLSDNILIEPIGSVSNSSIVIPESAQKKSNRGKVLSVGPGARDANGNLIPTALSVGDSVIYRQWAGSDYESGGKKFAIMRESDVLAVLGAVS